MTKPMAPEIVKSAACVIALFGALLATRADAVRACDTPVYRYAMYRWEAAPYEIYYFHEEPITEAAAKVHKTVEEAAKSEDDSANVFFLAVDVKADPELKTVPRDVRKWWLEQEEAKAPCYVVVTPYGVPVYHGELDDAAIKTLLDSPARQAALEQLADGKAGVMMLLTGSDDKANAEAEKLIKEFVADIASGKIELYLPPTAGFFAPPEQGEDDQQPESPTIEVGFVRVERNEAKEKWLVESLLSMEEDLKNDEFVDKPMMFLVFGRGRALPPCVGKGVNRDNLLDVVDFVTGACSCTVKDQNPGMDLLFTADWYKAAETLAAKHGVEEGNEYEMAAEDFFPNLIIPAAESDDTAGATEEMPAETVATTATEAETPSESPGESEAATLRTSAKSEDSAAEEPAGSQVAKNTAEEERAGELANAADKAAAGEVDRRAGDHAHHEVAAGTTATAHAASPAQAVGEAGSHGVFRGVFVVGAGIVVAFVLLFGMTFIVLRPR